MQRPPEAKITREKAHLFLFLILFDAQPVADYSRGQRKHVLLADLSGEMNLDINDKCHELNLLVPLIPTIALSPSIFLQK